MNLIKNINKISQIIKQETVAIIPIFIVLGVFIASLMSNDYILATCLLIILCAASLFLAHKRNYSLLLIFILVGIVCTFNQKIKFKEFDKNIKIYYAKGVIYDIENIKGNKYKLIVNNVKSKYKRFDRISLIYHKKDHRDLSPGDKIKFSAILVPQKNKNGFAKYLKSQYIQATGYAFKEIYTINNNQHRYSKKISINRFRSYLHKKIKIACVNEDHASIIAALILGKKSGINKDILQNIRIAGIAHLFAISGIHISIVTKFFYNIFIKILSISYRISNRFNNIKISSALSILMSFVYLLISGAGFSTQRAFIMLFIYYLNIIFEKQTISTNILSITLSIIVIHCPYSIYCPGMYLSFYAVMALIYSDEIYRKYINDNNKLSNKITKSLFASVVITLITAPYSIYYFHFISVSGIICNIFAIPLASLLIIPLSFIMAFSLVFFDKFFLSWLLGKAIDLLLLIAKIGSVHDRSTIRINSSSCHFLILFSAAFFILFVYRKHIARITFIKICTTTSLVLLFIRCSRYLLLLLKTYK